MAVNVEQITAEALKLKPAKVFGLVVAAPFVVLGMVLRLLWLAPALLISAGIDGWRQADDAYERWRGRVPGTKS
jgi:hypothetical protein